MNKTNEKAASLEEFSAELDSYEEEKESVFKDVVGQDSLTRFDKPKGKRRKKNRGKRNRNFKNSNRNSQPKKK